MYAGCGGLLGNEIRHHERGARLHQMHRGTLYDAYQARNACQRWNYASLARARAQYVESGLVVGATKPAISCQFFSLKFLWIVAVALSEEHGTFLDISLSRSALRQRNHAALSCPGIQLWLSGMPLS